MDDWKNKEPTPKQRSLIKDIEDEFGTPFTGKTRGEAAAYIDKWLSIAHSDIDRNYNWDNECRNG